MTSLFDQSVTALPAGGGGISGSPSAAINGTVAAADAMTINALAATGVHVAVLVYTASDPHVFVGDTLQVAGKSYPVVAGTRPYASDAMGMSVFVTPCGPAA